VKGYTDLYEDGIKYEVVDEDDIKFKVGGDEDVKPVSSASKKRRYEPVVIIPRRRFRKAHLLNSPITQYGNMKVEDSTPSLVSSSQSSNPTSLLLTPTQKPAPIFPNSIKSDENPRRTIKPSLTSLSPSSLSSPITDIHHPMDQSHSQSRLIRSLEVQIFNLRERQARWKEKVKSSDLARNLAVEEVMGLKESKKKLEIVVKGLDRRCVGLDYQLGSAKREIERLRGLA